MKLTVHTFLSLDGVMQGPGARDEDPSGGFERGGWLVPHFDEDTGRVVDQWFQQADEVLLGRTTYAMMQPYWSQLANSDELVAKVLNTYPKYVVSGTLTDEQADWGDTTVLRGDFLARVRQLKQRSGRELQVHGSWQLAQALHNAGLIDMYRLLIFPVVVGQGKRLFDDGTVPSGFRVISRESTGSGATSLILEPTPFITSDLDPDVGEAKSA